MKHSSNDLYTGGKYFTCHPDWHEEDAAWKADLIYQIIKRNHISAHSMVEVGCGAGGILRALSLKDANIQSLKGYDISQQAIALAVPKQNDRLTFHNEDYLQVSSEEVDMLLVIDVLEHVDDYYGFLRKLKTRSNRFVFHIPLDLCCRTMIKSHVLLQQRESVGHIHYFCKEMVCWFLQDTGYQVIDWFYTKPVIDEQSPDSLKRRLQKRLRNLSFRLSKDMSAKLWGGYSMMVLAK
ncbi:MAG: class I SAM-dependent methyltransferase [Chitinophagaceae bacterium]